MLGAELGLKNFFKVMHSWNSLGIVSLLRQKILSVVVKQWNIMNYMYETENKKNALNGRRSLAMIIISRNFSR